MVSTLNAQAFACGLPVGIVLSSAAATWSQCARVAMSVSMPVCGCGMAMRCISRRLIEGPLSQESSGIPISQR